MASPFPFTAGQVLTAAQLNSIGEWTAYTPTTGGLTIGNGTLTGRYAQVNGLVFFNVSFVMGTTSAVTGDVSFGLPVTRVNTGRGGANGFYANTGTTYNTPAIADMGATSVQFRVMNTGSTYMGVSLISATVPFLWATTDTMSVAGFYEAA